jgi:gas vesicle protein
MPNSVNKIVKQASVVASAIGAGVLAGLMLAPKSGKETRKDIKNKLDETKDNIEKKSSEVKADMKEKTEEMKREVEKKVEELKR